VLIFIFAYAIRPKDFQSPFDATVVRLLNASGATIIGKTNCDEFGMGYLSSLLRAFRAFST